MRFDFYTVDISYIKNLYNIEHEVYFDETDKNYEKKPYIGIVVLYNKYNYFVPLTSAKDDHLTLKNDGLSHLLIHEVIEKKDIRENDVVKFICADKNNEDNDKYKKIYALINFSKAIPVPNNVFKKIRISNSKDRDLLNKEFNLAYQKRDKIKKKANIMIKVQHTSKIVVEGACDFEKCEQFCENWAFNQMSITIKKELLKESIYYINVGFIPQNIVNIVNGTYSRCKGFNKTNPELQKITIYAKDEFGQEKNVQLVVKVTPPDSGDSDSKSSEIEKEAINV